MAKILMARFYLKQNIYPYLSNKAPLNIFAENITVLPTVDYKVSVESSKNFSPKVLTFIAKNIG